jgi:hypothetical protein
LGPTRTSSLCNLFNNVMLSPKRFVLVPVNLHLPVDWTRYPRLSTLFSLASRKLALLSPDMPQLLKLWRLPRHNDHNHTHMHMHTHMHTLVNRLRRVLILPVVLLVHQGDRPSLVRMAWCQAKAAAHRKHMGLASVDKAAMAPHHHHQLLCSRHTLLPVRCTRRPLDPRPARRNLQQAPPQPLRTPHTDPLACPARRYPPQTLHRRVSPLGHMVYLPNPHTLLALCQQGHQNRRP